MNLHSANGTAFELENQSYLVLKRLKRLQKALPKLRKSERVVMDVCTMDSCEDRYSLLSWFLPNPCSLKEVSMVKKRSENTTSPCNIQEVAVKKMRSNKSHEFFAELKVLCKIHHIMWWVIINHTSQSSDHLHDPFLKGNKMSGTIWYMLSGLQNFWRSRSRDCFSRCHR